MFARRVIDVRGEGMCAARVSVSTSSLFGQPFDRLFLSVSAVNLKLTQIQPNPGPPREAILTQTLVSERRAVATE
jgi:hypothetical protein